MVVSTSKKRRAEMKNFLLSVTAFCVGMILTATARAGDLDWDFSRQLPPIEERLNPKRSMQAEKLKDDVRKKLDELESEKSTPPSVDPFSDENRSARKKQEDEESGEADKPSKDEPKKSKVQLYQEGYNRALKEEKVFLAWVGQNSEKICPRCVGDSKNEFVHVFVDSINGWTGPGIVVGVPENGVLWQAGKVDRWVEGDPIVGHLGSARAVAYRFKASRIEQRGGWTGGVNTQPQPRSSSSINSNEWDGNSLVHSPGQGGRVQRRAVATARMMVPRMAPVRMSGAGSFRAAPISASMGAFRGGGTVRGGGACRS